MTMSPHLKNYLEMRAIPYLLVPHAPTDTAYNAARAAHIPAQCMVKGVLLEDEEGYLMAATAATRSVDLPLINELTGRTLSLVDEAQLQHILGDCAVGAVPAIGEAFGIPTFWDQSLALQPSFYIEAGDHQSLARIGYFDFLKVMGEEKSLCLSC